MLVWLRAVTPGGIASPAASNSSRRIVCARRFGSFSIQGTSNCFANVLKPGQQLSGRSGASDLAKHHSPLPIPGVVALRPRNHGTVRQYPCVAGIAAHRPEFNLSLTTNHPPGEWNCAIVRDGHPQSLKEPGVPQTFALKNTGAYETGALNTRLPASIQSWRVFKASGLNAICGSWRSSHCIKPAGSGLDGRPDSSGKWSVSATHSRSSPICEWAGTSGWLAEPPSSPPKHPSRSVGLRHPTRPPPIVESTPILTKISSGQFASWLDRISSADNSILL